MLSIFQTLSSFVADWATFFAAVAALLTLLEMHRQRKHSYKPDIAVIEQVLHGYFQSAFSCEWAIEDDTAKKNELRSNHLDISIFNLGNGAAKNVSLTWDFDFDTFIKRLNFTNQEHKTGIEIDNTDFLLEFRESDELKAAVNLKPSLTQRKDYILPTSIERTPLKVSLPFAYTCLISNYFYLRFKVLFDDIDFPIPDLKLTIEYSDIANNKYKTAFAFNVDLIFFSHNKPMPDFAAFLRYKILS